MFSAQSASYLIRAISIAVRYSASRLQFKDDDAIDEQPVLEYQSQQYRLLPHLSAAIVFKVFTNWFMSTLSEFSKSASTGKVLSYGMEMHALSSATKPVCTWTVQNAIQDCREATGGHGYLKGIFQKFVKIHGDVMAFYVNFNNFLYILCN